MSDDQYIIYGGPVITTLTKDCKSIGEVFLKQAAKHGDKIIMIDAGSGAQLAYSDLVKQSIRLAECFIYAGIKPGDAIGICSENCIEFPTVIYAAFMIGAIIAPLNSTYTERELHHAMNLSYPKFVFASPTSIKKVENVAKQNKFIQNVILFGNKPRNGVETLKQFVSNSKASLIQNFKSRDVDVNDHVALILCSSGTTGLPKGVQLTHANLLDTMNRAEEGMEDVCFLSVIPWFHAFGFITMMSMVVNGLKLVYLPKFDDIVFLRSIEKYEVQVALMVPPLMVFLAKHPLVDKYNLSSLIGLFCGAAPLSKEIEDAVYKRIGVAIIRQGYGLSEMTLSALVQREGFMKPGSVGCVITGLYAKVIDPETGKILGPNKRGELCFKGPQIMKGYVGDSKATQATIDKDGWLHTGDIGYYDDDKEFFIVDRLKELIKYKAYQVPPAEIEAILLTNPKVKDAAVIGIPDDIAGELPLGFIVKQSNVLVTEEEILNYVAERVSSAKRLRGGVRFIDEIPKNPSGKILRRELRDLIKIQKSKL